MRVVVAGAGNVGRSIAGELLGNHHQVLLIEREPRAMKQSTVPAASWLAGDCCEIATLERADLEHCDVLVAATGDDKANLVVSLLAKTEYGVPRVVARVNHPKNEWLFTDSWGVDVSVSTPRMLTALVEEAVAVGDLVPLLRFRQSEAALVEVTLGPDSPLLGHHVSEVELPADCALVALLRQGRLVLPDPEATFEDHDEVLVVAASAEAEAAVGRLLGSARP